MSVRLETYIIRGVELGSGGVMSDDDDHENNRNSPTLKNPKKRRKKKTAKEQKAAAIKKQYEEALKAMPYLDFLQTDYWKKVRKKVLVRDKFRCQECGWSPQKAHLLDVHHTTYKNHGREHEHLEDLTTLCRRCHDKHHK